MVEFGNDIWTTLGVIAWTARFRSKRMNENLRATLQIQLHTPQEQRMFQYLVSYQKTYLS